MGKVLDICMRISEAAKLLDPWSWPRAEGGRTAISEIGIWVWEM